MYYLYFVLVGASLHPRDWSEDARRIIRLIVQKMGMVYYCGRIRTPRRGYGVRIRMSLLQRRQLLLLHMSLPQQYFLFGARFLQQPQAPSRNSPPIFLFFSFPIVSEIIAYLCTCTSGCSHLCLRLSLGVCVYHYTPMHNKSLPPPYLGG